MSNQIGLGLSGGGDSLALLLALRATHPDVEIHALIVDHGLRDGSATEAEQAAELARKTGAQAHILTSMQGRSGQAHARNARHVLLAEACRRLGLSLLCLGHTLDDRVETLRMRQMRSGPPERLTGPSSFDPSPAWPTGRGVVLARPFLSLRRAQLRAYLNRLGQDWIDDPSNEDFRYERVRLRKNAYVAGGAEETALLRLSDGTQAEMRQRHADAYALMQVGVTLHDWGGAKLHRSNFEDADPRLFQTLMQALVLAMSGRRDLPEAADCHALCRAVLERRAVTASGVHLTSEGWLGRDPGAVIGRADGTPGVHPIDLLPGQVADFDGRWHVRANTPVRLSAWGRDSQVAKPVPAVFRQGLLAVSSPETGELLALSGVNETDAVQIEPLASQRIAARLLPPVVPTWFDGEQCARNVVATLAKRDSKPNITG